MKLIVTERQFSKIRLVKESQEYLNTYKEYCNQKLNEVIKLYNNIMGMSLYELLSSESIVRNAYNAVEKISDDIYSARKNMVSLWDRGLIGSDDENFEFLIDDISDEAYKKARALDTILMDLDSLKNNVDDKELLNVFKDIKPMGIQSF